MTASGDLTLNDSVSNGKNARSGDTLWVAVYFESPSSEVKGYVKFHIVLAIVIVLAVVSGLKCAAVAIVRLIGAVYIPTVVEVTEIEVKKCGRRAKAEICGLAGVGNVTIFEEAVVVDSATAVVDTEADSVKPVGKLTHCILIGSVSKKIV